MQATAPVSGPARVVLSRGLTQPAAQWTCRPAPSSSSLHTAQTRCSTPMSASPSSSAPTGACEDGLCTLEGWRRALPGSAGAAPSPSLPPIVALGKFDALHKGHRALAAAAAALGGAPWMVSFSGIAEVLGWPSRLPLVAPCDRRRVMASWAELCGGVTPRECAIPFADVRAMSPEAFVRLLAEELQVAGVVVGSNYRFGYKAAGTAELLRTLGPQHGMQVRVLDLVAGLQSSGSPEGCVSSSTVRQALSAGDMALVADCLGRPYRLVASLAGVADGSGAAAAEAPPVLRVPAGVYSNQAPGPGKYRVRASLAGADSAAAAAGEGWQELEVVVSGEAGLRLDGLAPGAAGETLLLDFVA